MGDTRNIEDVPFDHGDKTSYLDMISYIQKKTGMSESEIFRNGVEMIYQALHLKWKRF